MFSREIFKKSYIHHIYYENEKVWCLWGYPSLQCFPNCIIDIPVKKKRKGIQRRQLTYGMGQSLKYVYFYQILHISMML